MSAEDRGRESDLAVMGANEFKQKRRLKAILDARQKVKEKANKAEKYYIEGQISAVARQLVVLRAVREYIRECMNLLWEHAESAHDPDERCYYLEERTLGHIEFPNEGRRREINGLYQLLYCKEVYQESWEEVREYPHGSDEIITRTREHAVPLDVSWEGYLLLNRFLAEEHDLEIRFEEMDDNLPSWGFEEVPEEEGTEELATKDSSEEVTASGDD